MLTCEQALELISAQLDGALTAEEAGALDEHLAQCPACRALRADLSTLHQIGVKHNLHIPQNILPDFT